MISIVTIFHNNFNEVLRTYDELKDQTYKDWILIAINDNSSEIINYNKSVYKNLYVYDYPSPFQIGYSKKFNFGYEKSKIFNPEYIYKIHTDMSFPDKFLLQELIKSINLDDITVCVGPTIYNSNNIKTWGPGIVKKRCGHSFKVHESYFLKSDYVFQNDGFMCNEFDWFGEEMDYFVRIQNKKLNIKQISNHIIHYGGATSSSFSKIKTFHRSKSTLIFLRKHNNHFKLYQNIRFYFEEITPNLKLVFKNLIKLNFIDSINGIIMLTNGFIQGLTIKIKK